MGPETGDVGEEEVGHAHGRQAGSSPREEASVNAQLKGRRPRRSGVAGAVVNAGHDKTARVGTSCLPPPMHSEDAATRALIEVVTSTCPC
jgi:hypothetical protein